MENKDFNQLLSDANGHIDKLYQMVQDTIKAEDIMIQNALNPIPLILPQEENIFDKDA